jgi:hypothetical protein
VLSLLLPVLSISQVTWHSKWKMTLKAQVAFVEYSIILANRRVGMVHLGSVPTNHPRFFSQLCGRRHRFETCDGAVRTPEVRLRGCNLSFSKAHRFEQLLSAPQTPFVRSWETTAPGRTNHCQSSTMYLDTNLGLRSGIILGVPASEDSARQPVIRTEHSSIPLPFRSSKTTAPPATGATFAS